MKSNSNSASIGTNDLFIHDFTDADDSRGDYRNIQKSKNLSVKIPKPRVYSTNDYTLSSCSPRVSSRLSGRQSAAQSISPQYLTTAECKKLCFFGVEKMDALLHDIYSDLQQDRFKNNKSF
jgi:hypothetical protein